MVSMVGAHNLHAICTLSTQNECDSVSEKDVRQGSKHRTGMGRREIPVVTYRVKNMCETGIET